jgi:hypothetical protein
MAFLWDSVELENPHKNRAAWEPSPQKEYSFITGEMIPFESNQSRVLRTLGSSVSLFLLYILVIAFGAIDVVIYAFVNNHTVLGTDVTYNYGVPGAIGIVAVVACVHLLFVEWVTINHEF